jgi:SAM-dependent methyltransferase
MRELFDAYRSSYGEEVEQSVGFSGLKHEFFLKAKSDLIQRLIVERGLQAGGSRLRALDIGCGIGSLHKHLKGTFDSMSGCDISSQSIVRATGDNPENSYRVCTHSSLPFDDGAFDLAFASCVVHHVPPPSWGAFFLEMRRVVRPGGVACIIEHNPFNPLTQLAVFRCPFDADAVLLSSKMASRLMASAGFEQVKTEHFLLFPTATSAARRLERSLSRLPLGAQYACSGFV